MSGATFQAVIPTGAAGGVEGSMSSLIWIQHPASEPSGTDTETGTEAAELGVVGREFKIPNSEFRIPLLVRGRPAAV
jgi:hypothetical protein